MPTKKILYFLAGIGIFLILAIIWFTTARPIVVLPRVRLAPGYGFHTLTGNLISSESQRGKIILYTFTVPNCGDQCAYLDQTLTSLDHLLTASPIDTSPAPFEVITFWLDPNTSTGAEIPPQMFSFPRTWLSGDADRLKLVVGSGFEVFYQLQSDGSYRIHPKMVLVDGWGIIRAEYEFPRLSAERIYNDLALLMKEISQSKGTARLAYEAAHFFACYPH